jgi:hypothetical protein
MTGSKGRKAGASSSADHISAGNAQQNKAAGSSEAAYPQAYHRAALPCFERCASDQSHGGRVLLEIVRSSWLSITSGRVAEGAADLHRLLLRAGMIPPETPGPTIARRSDVRAAPPAA